LIRFYVFISFIGMSRGPTNIIESHTYYPASAKSGVSCTVTSGAVVSPLFSSRCSPGVVGGSGPVPVIPEFSAGTSYTVEQLQNRRPGNC